MVAAFDEEIPNGKRGYNSLSKREWLAGIIMASMQANPDTCRYANELLKQGMTRDKIAASNAHCAALFADALLAELEKE